jgi:hypothetical protein
VLRLSALAIFMNDAIYIFRGDAQLPGLPGTVADKPTIFGNEFVYRHGILGLLRLGLLDEVHHHRVSSRSRGRLKRAIARPPSGWDISFDRDVLRVLPCLRHVIGELHAKKMVHVRAEGLFDAQGHFRRQGCLAVQKIGERSAAHLQNVRRLRHVEAEGFDDFGPDQLARMGCSSFPRSRKPAASFR